MLTSASIRAFWMSLTIVSISFLSMNIAFDIFLTPLTNTDPSFSSTM